VRASPFTTVVERLETQGLTVRGRGASRMATCPHHAGGKERTPSLHITNAGDRALIHCHAGCTTADVLASLGLEMRDLYANTRQRVAAASLHLAADRRRELVALAGAPVPDGTPELHRRVLRIVVSHDFNGSGEACPAETLIAARLQLEDERLGLKRPGANQPSVSRAVRWLEARGLVAIHQIPRRGKPGVFNIYTLLCSWSRPNRRLVLRDLDEIRRRERVALIARLSLLNTKRREDVKARSRRGEGAGAGRSARRRGCRGKPPPDLGRRLAALDVYFRSARCEPLDRPRAGREVCAVSERRLVAFSLAHASLAAAV
jgi:hypothetical protein